MDSRNKFTRTIPQSRLYTSLFLFIFVRQWKESIQSSLRNQCFRITSSHNQPNHRSQFRKTKSNDMRIYNFFSKWNKITLLKEVAYWLCQLSSNHYLSAVMAVESVQTSRLFRIIYIKYYLITYIGNAFSFFSLKISGLLLVEFLKY